MKNEIKHTAHSSYRCEYHIVFAPKYRRKVIYKELRKDIGVIFRKLCNEMKVEIIEAEACVDHIHMLISIPLYLSIAHVVGTFKSKSALMIFDRYANLKYKYGSRNAIVLPANEKLKEGPGTSAAIFEAAGRKKLTKACENIGHCDTGSAVPTVAFDLDAKYIIHTVVPRWIDGNHGEYDLLSSAYLSAMNIADVMGCKTIAFPVLAAGHNGFDRELAIQIAKESIEHFASANLQKVTLVIYGDNMENYMKSLGYTVLTIPEDLQKSVEKALKKAKREKMLADGKEVAQKFLEEQIAKAIEWLKDEEHRELVVKYAKEAVKLARIAVKK